MKSGNASVSTRTLAGCLAAAFILGGCGIFTKKSEDKNPLVVTECPETLPPLKDNATFGDSNLKLIEVANIYHSCVKAVKAGVAK